MPVVSANSAFQQQGFETRKKLALPLAVGAGLAFAGGQCFVAGGALQMQSMVGSTATLAPRPSGHGASSSTAEASTAGAGVLSKSMVVAASALAVAGSTTAGRRRVGGRAVKVVVAAEGDAKAEETSEPKKPEEVKAEEPPTAEAEEKTEAEGDAGVPEVEEAGEEEVDDKPEEPKAEANKPQKWACVDCGAANFPSSEECHKCGAAKPSMAESQLIKERTAAKEQMAKVMDDFLRLQADLQNYRRKHEDSMANAKDLGKKDALRKLVPFTNEIEKALEPPTDMTDREKALFDSYSLLFKKVHDVWNKFDVAAQEVEVGSKFDAMSHFKAEEREPESDDQAPGTILEVLQPGWTFEGKVLVPSDVAIVAFPKGEEDEEPEEPAEDDADEDLEEEGAGEADESKEVKEDVKA